MSKPAPRMAQVLARQTITPNMLRLTLGGADLADFPQGVGGGYIKLHFPDVPRTNPDRPVMRTYSIRAQSPGQIEVDFALHGDAGGIATEWAMGARPGDTIPISGPGRVKLADPEADWVMLAADMTGLPALANNAPLLRDDARGYAVIEITSEADRQDLALPEGVELHWVVNPTPDTTKGALEGAIKALPWLPGRPFVWTACEFDTMRALRGYYRNERGVGREDIYLSSYWRAGRTEDQHKVDKSKDAEAQKAQL